MSATGGQSSITACAYVNARTAGDGGSIAGIRVLGLAEGGLPAPAPTGQPRGDVVAGQSRGSRSGLTLRDRTGRRGGDHRGSPGCGQRDSAGCRGCTHLALGDVILAIGLFR